MSMADEDEKAKLKTTIEILASFGFSLNQCSRTKDVVSIDEQMRQLQKKRATIIPKVSEDVRSNEPLEAQLR
ncbi:unnamed protein product [Prunus armeniaca]